MICLGIWVGYLAYNEEGFKAYKDKRGITSTVEEGGGKGGTKKK